MRGKRTEIIVKICQYIFKQNTKRNERTFAQWKHFLKNNWIYKYYGKNCFENLRFGF